MITLLFAPILGAVPPVWIDTFVSCINSANVHEVAGVLGCLIYMTTYSLVVNGKCIASGPKAVSANVASALLVLFSLSLNFNIGSALMQCFSITVGTIRLLSIAKNQQHSKTNTSTTLQSKLNYTQQ